MSEAPSGPLAGDPPTALPPPEAAAAPGAAAAAAPPPGAAAPAGLPTPEQASRMAADMLTSAVTQRDAIARSFEQQRAGVLDALAAQRARTLEASAPAPAAAGGGPQAGAAAEQPVPAGPQAQAGTPAGAAGPTAPAAAGPAGADAPGAAGHDDSARAHAAETAAGGLAMNAQQLQALLGLLNAAGPVLDRTSIAVQLVEALKTLVAQEVRAQLKAMREQTGPPPVG